MLKTVDDKIFSIINRKLPLEKRFKKLTSNARNVLYTLIIKSKNENKEITLTTFNSESVFNLKRDLFIKAINELIKDKTVIIIAHRLNTIKDANKIIVMDDGKIIESGNHEKLMNDKGTYYSMFTAMEKAKEFSI